ncbi:MAG: dihydropteroate synthase [Deltaproteobacteria bacterium]|nr:dihydropteroate synthase [Deltaproteobacteria bacterium]
MRRPLVMGILNVTPDSFHDGGRYLDAARAVDRALGMADEGADWVDVGGASTRPGALPVPPEVQADRILPVVRDLVHLRPALTVSVDTGSAWVARRALDAGASVINDVDALSDPDMAAVVAEAGASVVLMHMRGTPADMQDDPRYDDVVGEVRAFLLGRAARAHAAGVVRDRILVDPGIGFGKTADHCLALIRGLPTLAATGYPVVVGPSRKSFIGRVLDLPDTHDRLEGSIAAAVLAVWLGAAVVRVHDVRETRRAVDLAAAIQGSAA